MRAPHALLLFTSAFLFVNAGNVRYTDCGSSVSVHSVSVEPCQGTPCSLTRGSTATTQISFQAGQYAGSSGTVEVFGIVRNSPVPVNLDSPQICGHVQPNCPLQSGQWYTYTKNMFIDVSYPAMPLNVRWVLKDSHGGQMVCVEIPIQLV
ncbi:Niemann-Pick C2 protein [Clonorchis sinensis]|uniref:Niemann-Pick C2 protein n=1 Tax=Clonorchis sinensis TaxID=79923 RepID=G7YQZ6_CLOSI|nr:Niemann-Pick C2 protein [Clonorchis sinensis]